jgi:hypothetical protein
MSLLSEKKTLRYNELMPNKQNIYSMDGIESLADEIELSGGLMQNLVAKEMPNGKYLLISGHRRLAAIKFLVEERGLGQYAEVDCLIFDESVSAEKAEYMLHMSNMTTRVATEYELMTGLGAMRALRRKLAIVESGRMSEILGREIGLGSAQTQKYLSVFDRGSDDLKEKLKDGTVRIEEAYKIVIAEDKMKKGLDPKLPLNRNKPRSKPAAADEPLLDDEPIKIKTAQLNPREEKEGRRLELDVDLDELVELDDEDELVELGDPFEEEDPDSMVEEYVGAKASPAEKMAAEKLRGKAWGEESATRSAGQESRGDRLDEVLEAFSCLRNAVNALTILGGEQTAFLASRTAWKMDELEACLKEWWEV